MGEKDKENKSKGDEEGGENADEGKNNTASIIKTRIDDESGGKNDASSSKDETIHSHRKPEEDKITSECNASFPAETKSFDEKTLKRIQDIREQRRLLAPKNNGNSEKTKTSSIFSKKAKQKEHVEEDMDEMIQDSFHSIKNVINRKLKVDATVAPITNREQASSCCALISVTHKFRNLPAISENLKFLCKEIHSTLIGLNFGRFNSKSCHFLANPSIVEFKDTMDNLAKSCKRNDALFVLIVSHGVRIAHGSNSGSYIMFPESRISTEDELLVTSISDKQLATYLQAIPCKNKLVALEVVQKQNIVKDDDSTIRGRIHANFIKTLHDNLVDIIHKHADTSSTSRMDESISCNKMNNRTASHRVSIREKETIKEEEEKRTGESELNKYSKLEIRSNPDILCTVLMESCDPKTQIPLKEEGQESNFIRRVLDAFRGAACDPGKLDEYKNWQEDDSKLPILYAGDICQYVAAKVAEDAKVQHARRRATVEKEKSKFEQSASKSDNLCQSVQIVGVPTGFDFQISNAPRQPDAPPAPCFSISTRTTMKLTWQTSLESKLAPVLGYHLQKRSGARAGTDDAWIDAGPKIINSFDEVHRLGRALPSEVVIRGISPDNVYQFRIRARNPGGWGPFSSPSAVFRAGAYVYSTSVQQNMQKKMEINGVEDIVKLMTEYPDTSIVQRRGCEWLAKFALNNRKDPSNANRLFNAFALQTVLKAMKRFNKDVVLLRNGNEMMIRMAIFDDVRIKITTARTGVKKVLQDILDKFGKEYYTDLHQSAKSALTILSKKPEKRSYGVNEAAMKIQGIFRSKKAREMVRHLASLLHERVYDPASDSYYYYNTRTGETSWSAPKVLDEHKT